MKGPSNISVRLDLFEEKNNSPNKSEQNLEMKSSADKNPTLKWNEIEQMNRQVVFINPEWDEIEEEKAGIPAFLSSITPKKSVSPHSTEFLVTDSESVSSMTVSLDELVEESEEVVTVIASRTRDADLKVVHDELAPMVVEYSEIKSPKPFVNDVENVEWKNPEVMKMESRIVNPQLVKPPKTKATAQPNEYNKKYDGSESNKLMKASCYVVQNGRVTKPFYIVKNPVVRSDGTSKGERNAVDVTIEDKTMKSVESASASEEMKNLLPLGRQNAPKKKENFQETIDFSKSTKNQGYIAIIEHPAKDKRVVLGKSRECKLKSDGSFKKPATDSLGNFRKNCATDSKSYSGESEDLMWLLDFKLDDLFSESSLPALSHLDDNLEYNEFPGKLVNMSGSATNLTTAQGERTGVEIGCQTETSVSKSNKSSASKMAQRHQQKMENKAESSVTNRTFNDLKYSENRKPPFTYTELIECALQEKGPLTVSEIYHWISETFPYYKSWDDRWKNSVRHNLSINPYFRKGTKARQGSGHLWTVNKSDDNSKINSWKRQRFHEFEEFNKRLRLADEAERHDYSTESVSSSKILDETELATASIEDKENRKLHKDVLMAACVDNNMTCASSVSLEQSAEEILSGVKKTVEVQYLEPVKSSSPCENDFLNPISKEILMGECGLLNQIELNLTAETGEHLSIVDGMTDSEHIFGITDELNFQYDITTHPPTLMSLAK